MYLRFRGENPRWSGDRCCGAAGSRSITRAPHPCSPSAPGFQGDIAVITDPGTVWRVGYRPDRWTWTPWQYAEGTDGETTPTGTTEDSQVLA